MTNVIHSLTVMFEDWSETQAFPKMNVVFTNVSKLSKDYSIITPNQRIGEMINQYKAELVESIYNFYQHKINKKLIQHRVGLLFPDSSFYFYNDSVVEDHSVELLEIERLIDDNINHQNVFLVAGQYEPV